MNKMTRVAYFSCVCRHMHLFSPNIRNAVHPTTILGSVAEPVRSYTNRCLPHLAAFTPRLQPRTPELCSPQQQYSSSDVLLTNDETWSKVATKEFPAITSNDLDKILSTTHSDVYRLWLTRRRLANRANQPWTGSLQSSFTHYGLTDTTLLANYANTGVLSSRWLCTTAKTHSVKRSDDKDESNKGKEGYHEVDESKLSLLQKFKQMYRQYWYVLLPVHCATSVVWFGSFFLAAKSGVDIVPLLKTVGVTSETILGHLQDSNTGYVALAYAMYKVATPARYTVTLGCTTFSINYLKNKGYIKPVPSKDELVSMYEDKRDEMLERSNEMREQFQVRRDELQDKLDQRRTQIKSNFEERRGAIRNRFEERREEMKDRFEERRDELRQRFGSPADRLEDTLDQIKKQEDKLTKKASGALNGLKDNLEQKTESIKKKLEGVEERIASDVIKTDDTKK